MMQEASIETVARPNRVYWLNPPRRTRKPCRSPLGQPSLRTKLDYNQRYDVGQSQNRSFQIFCPRRQFSLAFVGQKNIHAAKHFSQSAFPSVVRIVIRVERNGESGCFHPLKQLDNSWP